MPKRKYQPNKQKRAKTHGFLARKSTINGQRVMRRRRSRGRHSLVVQKYVK